MAGLHRAASLAVLLLGASCVHYPLDAWSEPFALIEVRPARAALQIGDSMQLEAALTDALGRTRTGEGVRWSSSDTAVAHVDSTGLLFAKRSGSVEITAAGSGRAGNAAVAVAPAILVGAGDIAHCSSSGDEATADLLDAVFGTVFTAGDNVYEFGTTDEFVQCYHPSWGRHKGRTRPAPGNHEYLTPGAAAYFAYFGEAAGDATKGYYSYDLGSWHVVVINTSLAVHPGSPQEQWLRADLAEHGAQCTVAYWHYPRFSSGYQGNHIAMEGLWQALYDAGADVVISAHDHHYERFAPQTPTGLPDSSRGIRQFVVGTGGKSLLGIKSAAPNSEIRDNSTFGVLLLKLYDEWYEWEFLPAHPGGFTDVGAGRCH